LDRPAIAADQVVVGIAGSGKLVVERAIHDLNPTQDPASLKQGQGPVDGRAGEPMPHPPEPKPQRFRVEMSLRPRDSVDDEAPLAGGP